MIRAGANRYDTCLTPVPHASLTYTHDPGRRQQADGPLTDENERFTLTRNLNPKSFTLNPLIDENERFTLTRKSDNTSKNA